MKCKCLGCYVGQYCEAGKKEREKAKAELIKSGHYMVWEGCACGSEWNDELDCCEFRLEEERASVKASMKASGWKRR